MNAAAGLNFRIMITFTLFYDIRSSLVTSKVLENVNFDFTISLNFAIAFFRFLFYSK